MSAGPGDFVVCIDAGRYGERPVRLTEGRVYRIEAWTPMTRTTACERCFMRHDAVLLFGRRDQNEAYCPGRFREGVTQGARDAMAFMETFQ